MRYLLGLTLLICATACGSRAMETKQSEDQTSEVKEVSPDLNLATKPAATCPTTPIITVILILRLYRLPCSTSLSCFSSPATSVHRKRGNPDLSLCR